VQSPLDLVGCDLSESTRTNNYISDKLSFVLPVTLHESGMQSWRSSFSVNTLPEKRIDLLLKSLLQMFTLDDLEQFIIICPADQIKKIDHILSKHKIDSKFLIVDEKSICPEISYAIDRF
jgi:hypothetical protein